MAALRLIFCMGFLLLTGLAEAEEQRVLSIEIIGLERTDERTVIRQLPFVVGDIWQDDFAPTGERWLRNLGIFSEAHISRPDERGHVSIHLRERWSLWVLPTFSRKDTGASSAGVTVDEYNLWGLNHHLRLSGREDTGKNFSTANGSSYAVAYDWRRIADSKLSISAATDWGRSSFDAYKNGVQVAQYAQDGRSVSLMLSYGFGPVPGEGLSVSAGFSGSNSSFALLSGLAQPDVIGNRKRTVIGGISYQNVNNEITWFSGTAYDYSLAVSHKALGSTINVYRQSLSIRSYVPFDDHNTINLRLNAGLVSGDVLRDGLFDIGNRTGIRGYYPGEVQGKSYVYGTVEGRYLLSPESNVQLVAFSDVGLVRGGSAFQGKTFFAGMGGGIRWTLRWLVNGTIRGDAAYGFASRRWRFYLGSGQAF